MTLGDSVLTKLNSLPDPVLPSPPSRSEPDLAPRSTTQIPNTASPEYLLRYERNSGMLSDTHQQHVWVHCRYEAGAARWMFVGMVGDRAGLGLGGVESCYLGRVFVAGGV